MLQNMIKTFLDQTHSNFLEVSQKSYFEVYSNVAAIKLYVPCVDRTAEVLFVERRDPNAFHDKTVVRSNIISGKALYEIAADISVKAAND